MTDFDVRSGLADIATQVQPADMYDRVLRRSQQIRRRRAGLAALGAAVAVLLIGGTTWQLLPQAAPAPPADPSPPAETSPPLPQTSGPPTPRTALGNATLTLPAWPGPREEIGLGDCPTGPITFVDDWYHDDARGMHLTMLREVTVDVGDATHHVGLFMCRGPGEGTASQVVAYRATADGYALVGAIVDNSVVTHEEAELAFLGLMSGGDGEVTVDVIAQLAIGTWPPEYSRLSQHRTYSWDGSQYVQSAGPTSFLTDRSAADLTLTTSELVFAPEVDGCRTGEMTITVTNNGSRAVSDIAVALLVRGSGEAATIDCPEVPATQGDDSSLVPVGTLNAGESRTIAVTMVVDMSMDPNDETRFGLPSSRVADLRVGDTRYGTTVPIVIRY